MKIEQFINAFVTQLNDMYEFELKKRLDEQRKLLEAERDPLKTINSQQFADLLGVETTYVQRLARQGTVKAIRSGKRYMFRKSEVMRYILSLEEQREKDIQKTCNKYGVSRKAL